METNASGDGAGRNYTPRCRRNVPVIAPRLRLGLNGAPRPHRRCPQDRLVDRRGSFLLHPDLLHRQLPRGESRGLSEQPVVVPCGREQQGPPGGVTDVPNRRRLSAAFRSASASWPQASQAKSLPRRVPRGPPRERLCPVSCGCPISTGRPSGPADRLRNDRAPTEAGQVFDRHASSIASSTIRLLMAWFSAAWKRLS
jgi:hypothetical protein